MCRKLKRKKNRKGSRQMRQNVLKSLACLLVLLILMPPNVKMMMVSYKVRHTAGMRATVKIKLKPI